MARQPRIQLEGALYHVMSRGNDGIDIFRDEQDRERFLTLLADEVARSGWTLHDYCLMSNHYHLSLSMNRCTLSTGMHRLLTRYVQYFNRRHGRRGHLFQERFKSVLVQADSHALTLTRYIALNPVRASLCKRPEEWRWSSYRARGGLDEAPGWLSLRPLADEFGATASAQRRAYREFVLAAILLEDDGTDVPLAGLFLGTVEWLQRVQERIDQQDRSQEHPREQVHPGRPDLDDVMAIVAETFSTTPEEIRAGRGRIERRVAAYLAFEEGLVPLRRIASALSLRSAGRVSDLVRRCSTELRNDPAFREIVTNCRQRVRRAPPPFIAPAEISLRGARTFHRAPSLRMR